MIFIGHRCDQNLKTKLMRDKVSILELDYSTKLMRLKCTLLAASKRSDTVTIHPTLSNTSALCCLLISSSHVTVCAMSNLSK